MNKVRKLIAAGSTIPGAIKEALGMSIAEFAIKYARPRGVTGQVLLGRKTPTKKDVEALIAELGGTEQEWLELLHEAGRPVAQSA